MPNKGVVCTLGPASWNMIRELREAGMTLARINGAFGLPYKGAIRELKDIGVQILVDVPGERKKDKLGYVTDDELIQFAIDNRLDYIGLSYVKNAEDIKKVREKLGGSNVRIIAKIENGEAVQNREEIIKESDKVLIDRGDLGTDIGFEKVPRVQSLIIESAKMLGKDVIVATEMLMSTLKSTKPNCADVTDVYLAASQGADFIMLSEETALGKNPVDTVKITRRILDEVC